jgi:hypothetical protein
LLAESLNTFTTIVYGFLGIVLILAVLVAAPLGLAQSRALTIALGVAMAVAGVWLAVAAGGVLRPVGLLLLLFGVFVTVGGLRQLVDWVRTRRDG